MMSNPGVAAKLFESLYNNGININMISTSEIRITVLIDEKEIDKAMQAVHDGFGLEMCKNEEENKKEGEVGPSLVYLQKDFAKIRAVSSDSERCCDIVDRTLHLRQTSRGVKCSADMASAKFNFCNLESESLPEKISSSMVSESESGIIASFSMQIPSIFVLRCSWPSAVRGRLCSSRIIMPRDL